MAERGWTPRRLAPVAAAIALGLLLILLEPSPLAGRFDVVFGALALGTLAVAGAYAAWRVDPAWVFAVALFLSVFAGNWENIGIPGAAAPDRLLLIIGLVAIFLRARGVGARPPLRVSAAHWVLATASVYAVVSALFADSLLPPGALLYPQAWPSLPSLVDRASFFGLLEHFAILPFLVFLAAQTAFRTERQRRILLGALVALGAYLGITALLEAIGADSLLFPPYIADPNVGIHQDERARGPFVEAVTNGVGLYACALGGVIAFMTWNRQAWRVTAAGVTLLCAAGLLFTLQRSVWLATVVATVVTLAGVSELRRRAVPVLLAGAACVVALLTFVPGLSGNVERREGQEETVWERRNQATAAINMIDERPLLGFGWQRFRDRSIDYYELHPDFPLTGTGIDVHNVYLRYGAELGLLGLALWLGGLLLGVGGGLAARAPPGLRPWQIALGAFAVFYIVIAAFVPAQLFPNLMLWVFAGVAWNARLGQEAAEPQSSGPIVPRTSVSPSAA